MWMQSRSSVFSGHNNPNLITIRAPEAAGFWGKQLHQLSSYPSMVHPSWCVGGELLGMLRNLLLGYKMESVKTEASGARGTQHKASDSKISSNLLFPPPTHSLIPPHFHSLNGNSFNLYCVKTGRACVFEFTLRVLRLDLQQVNRSVCHLFLLLANHLPHLCLRSSSCSLRGHLEISYCG